MSEEKRMNYTVRGRGILGRGFETYDVEIIVENGIIAEINETSLTDAEKLIWIVPSFFNAHTHLADTAAMDVKINPGMTLSDLVAPPNGLKHRILNSLSGEVLTDAMRSSMLFMRNTGTRGFCDFREGGKTGAALLKNAVSSLAASGTDIDSVILGRSGGETISDGIGVSSTKEGEAVMNAAADTKKRGGILAFHAGEKDSGDVDSAIDAEPDLLIHMTHATDTQLKRCADKNIPIAVCPRSNWILNASSSSENPPIRRMLELGCRVYLGTDNVMFVQPDIFSEMSFVSTVYRLPPETVLDMAVGGSELLRLKKPDAHTSVMCRSDMQNTAYYICENTKAAFFTIDAGRSNLRFSQTPIKTIANRAGTIGI